MNYQIGAHSALVSLGLEKYASVNLTFQGVNAPHAAVRSALAKDPDTFTDWLESKEVMDDKGSPFSRNSDLSINTRSLTNPKYDLHKNVAGDLWGMGDYHVPKPLTQAAAMKVIDELEQMHPGVNDHTNKMRKALQNLYARPDAKSVYLTYT